MREIVTKQAEAELEADIEERRENFHALAYAVSGNPRLLLKTVALSQRLKTADVEKVLKEFYRTDIWAEHSGLADRYAGHRAFIDWGRVFIEKTVIPDCIKRNEQWANEGKSETTCYFWIHRDTPVAVNEALRLLSYTGIVTRLDSGVVATRSEIGTRYAVNLGCLTSPAAKPITTLTMFGRSLSIKRFTEYGANHPSFAALTSVVGQFEEPDISTVLARRARQASGSAGYNRLPARRTAVNRLGYRRQVSAGVGTGVSAHQLRWAKAVEENDECHRFVSAGIPLGLDYRQRSLAGHLSSLPTLTTSARPYGNPIHWPAPAPQDCDPREPRGRVAAVLPSPFTLPSRFPHPRGDGPVKAPVSSTAKSFSPPAWGWSGALDGLGFFAAIPRGWKTPNAQGAKRACRCPVAG